MLASRAFLRHVVRAAAGTRGRSFSLPAHEVVGLPALSPTMEAGTIASWKVDEGSSFSAGTVLCEVETDKAIVDFVATDEGIVAKILVAAGGGEVKVGEPVLVVVEEAADVAAFASFSPEPAAAAAAAGSGLKLANAATSAASSTTTRTGSPTFTSPPPAATRIFATMPSSVATKSTIALSVSTSHSTVPAENEEPSSTFQEAIVPASIVGERAGKPTTSCAGSENDRPRVPAAARTTWRRKALEASIACHQLKEKIKYTGCIGSDQRVTMMEDAASHVAQRGSVIHGFPCRFSMIWDVSSGRCSETHHATTYKRTWREI